MVIIRLIVSVITLFYCISTSSQNLVRLEKADDGVRLLVDEKPFMVNGMNWDYFPIGTNYEYSIWDQPDEFIINVLDYEMSLLRDMGVNAVRQYTGIPSKWITYIYEKYGIYTMLNHSFGRYGLTIDGEWVATTDYGDLRTKELLLSEISNMVEEFEGTPGLLLYLLGNENNYGLFWEGAETEDIPIENEESASRARNLYVLFNEAAEIIKQRDKHHPVAICNGDLQFLDLIKEECKSIDIFGANVYRGVSFGDFYEQVSRNLGLPVLLTEFGADAFDALKVEENEDFQARCNLLNWKEIYENASGLGKAENSIGGFTFQFTDGWWKYGQTKGLDEHDSNASWVNGGYHFDFRKGQNNMNEEWFGICAKGPTREDGTYEVIPRKAYSALQKVHGIDPYNGKSDLEEIQKLIDRIIELQGLQSANAGASIDK